MKSRDRGAARRSWVVVFLAAAMVAAWTVFGALPDEASRMLADDIARAAESKPAARRALAFDWFRNSPRAVEVYRPLTTHPDRKVREAVLDTLAAQVRGGQESVVFATPDFPLMLDQSALALGLVEVPK